MTGKLGLGHLGAFKLGDSTTTAGPIDHFCFTYQGDDNPGIDYEAAAGFTYQGDDVPAFTYQGEC